MISLRSIMLVPPGCRSRAAPREGGSGPVARAALRGRSAQFARGPVLRPDRHPVAVLDLLDGLVARPEIVLLLVEGELAGERGLGALAVQAVAHRLLVERACGLHAADEDVPGVPRRGGLRLEDGV